MIKMAYTETKAKKCVHLKNFICDTTADVKNLPKCLPGSQAVVIATGDLYVVNASGEWAKFGGGA